MDDPAPNRRPVLASVLPWLLTAVPAAAVVFWVSFAGRWPEPTLDRFALRECVPSWRWDTLLEPTASPRHVVAQGLHRAALEIPGASVASVAWITALLAILLALSLGSLLRRSFDLRGLAAPATLLAAGLLVCSPGFGLVWLRGERLGLVLAPLLLVVGLGWLVRIERAPLRFLGVALLAGIAPFCHTHGLLVGFALLPAVFATARRAASRALFFWLGLVVAMALAGAWFSLEPIIAHGVSGGRAMWDVLPIGTFLLDLCEHTGAAWLDVIPDHGLDGVVLGAVSWLLPLVLLFVGDRSQVSRFRAATWWSCLWFGLALVLWDVLRYDAEPPVGRWREALFGSFFVPVGLVGLLACRFERSMLRVAFGALLVLGVQDWFLGLEDLRIARQLVLQQEAVLALPRDWHPDLAAAQDRLGVIAAKELRAKNWVPAEEPAPALPTSGGEVAERGELVSSLRTPAPVVLLWCASGMDGVPQVRAVQLPDFRRYGRAVAWERAGALSAAGFGVLPQPLRLGAPFRAN